MKISHFLRGLLVTCGLVLLVACSAKVKVNIFASANASLDENGKPLTVIVRVYQLTETKVFSNASFKELWKKDLKILGGGLLSREEVHMVPNSTKKLKLKKQANVKFIGVVALFRKPKDNKWRVVDAVGSGYVSKRFSQGYKITLRNNELILE